VLHLLVESKDFELDRKGYIKKRESFDLEFKQNFQLGDNLLKFIKTLVGMANNKGGQIIFGIKDKPHEPIGMTNQKFRETDPVTIEKMIREYFSSELEWSMNILEFNGKEFGQLFVKEAKYKPILCKKNKDGVLREAAVYYRYRAETKEIDFAELSNLLNQEREKEKALWIEHIQKISMIGPQNVHLLDIVKSEIKVGNGSILIIKEGEFNEVSGTPTLKLVGEITGMMDANTALPTDKLYPLFSRDLERKLNINGYQLKCLIWKLDIKGDKRFHTEIKAGKNSNFIQRYSESLINHINNFLQIEGYLIECAKEYQKANPIKRKERKEVKKRK
jgi:hypothetical protein